jgi:hypothetical protein
MNTTQLKEEYQTHLIRFIAAELAMTNSFDKILDREFQEIVLTTYKHYHTSNYDMTIDGLARIMAWLFESGEDYRSLYQVEQIWNEDC